MLASLEQIESAEKHIAPVLSSTPQINWPLLSRRAGCDVWVKHENHLPTGSFKVRGGLVYCGEAGGARGFVAATKGNHGQSIAFAADRIGVPLTIIVPIQNSADKNAAMEAYGGRLIRHGRDFNEAFDYACKFAASEGLHLVPSLHPLLIRGVATLSLELFRAVEALDTVYVPLGLGSGVLGAVSARNALGLETEVVGVVAAGAPAYARSFRRGEVVSTDRVETIADGLAVRVPDAEALELMRTHVSRIVEVSEDEIRAAVRHLYSDTHQVAEGAGAAAFAAIAQERERVAGRRVAGILSGGNIDRSTFVEILSEADPSAT